MFSLQPPRHIPTLPRLCENASFQRLLRIMFCVVPLRPMLKALLFFELPKSRPEIPLFKRASKFSHSLRQSATSQHVRVGGSFRRKRPWYPYRWCACCRGSLAVRPAIVVVCSCRHTDPWPDHMPVPAFGLRMDALRDRRGRRPAELAGSTGAGAAPPFVSSFVRRWRM
jgi:hypothetical protein